MSRRSDQRRAAVFALYQHELTGRAARRRVRARRRSVHARARARHGGPPGGARRRGSSATPRAGRSERIAPLERAIMRVALLEMLHPDLVEGDRPIPPEGAISEAVETAKEFCAAPGAGLRQRHPRRGAALRAREWRAACLTTRLDDLVDPARARRGRAARRRARARARRRARRRVRAAGLRGRRRARPARARRPTAAARRRRASSRSAREHARARHAGGPARLPRPPARAGRGATSAGCAFAREPAAAGPRGGDALLAARRRQADPAGARARDRARARAASRARCSRSPPRSS